MDIRINSLTLHNFKGVRGGRTFTFDGYNARIEGDNGTGKSTVFDAFTWLLFGKDHLGQDWTHFDIKPIDPDTGRTVGDLDYTGVEAYLTVNGFERSFRRVITEDWVKPRGEAERVLKGHTQAFFIDGMACATKKEYDAAIAALIPEDVFRIVTNPHYLIDDTYTDWKTRRKVLLSVVGYDPKVVDKDFADLVAEMRGEPVEQFRKRVAAAKKAQKEELVKSASNITAWQTALPEEVNEDEINATIDSIRAKCIQEAGAVKVEINKIDRSIADIGTRNKEAEKAVEEKNARIRTLRIKMGDYLGEAVNTARSESKALRQTEIELAGEVDAAKMELERAKTQRRGLDANLESYRLGLAEDSARLKKLGEEYEAERASTFEVNGDAACPFCGRPYDADTQEEHRQKWLEAKRGVLKALQAKAAPIRAEIASWKESIAKAEEHRAAVVSNIARLEGKVERLEAALEEHQGAPEIDVDAAEEAARRSEEYQSMAAMLGDLEKEAAEAAEGYVGSDDLLAQRHELEEKLAEIATREGVELRPMRDALVRGDERKRIQGLIDEEEKRRRMYAAELARLERIEVRTLEYIKASVDACEGAINAKFQEARWKMFDYTLDGGIIEKCEVTTREGVPYTSMNSAARILCGMDVIRVLGEAKGVRAPIFVDNAESVTRSAFIPGTQVVRLVVRKDAELAVIKE